MKNGKKEVRFSKPFEDKVEGWIFLNGNVATEYDLVQMFNEQIINPQHKDPQINKSKKVLLVTAAFQKGHEHHDHHLITMFEKLSIDPKWNGPYPQNIQNLSVYTMFTMFKEKEKWLYQKYTEKQDQIKAIKLDYLSKNNDYVRIVHSLTHELQEKYPELSLYDFYYFHEKYEKFPEFTEESTIERLENLKILSRNKYDLEKCKEIKETLDHLIYKDEEIFSICAHIEDFFLEKSGIKNCTYYKEQRADLNERIKSSASIFIFGGRVYVLVNRLRFYQLHEFFKEALKNGTNIYGISAGAICQTEKFSLNFEEFSVGGYLRAADIGMGLVKNLFVFPHANDYKYIMEADRNYLSFFTLRQKNGVVVGLSQKSVLLCEKYKDPIDGKIYSRFSSVGEEPVLVFGERGIRYDLEKFDQIFMPGTKFYINRNQIARAHEIEEIEKDYYKRINLLS